MRKYFFSDENIIVLKNPHFLVSGEVKKTQDFSLNNAQSPVHRLVVPDHKNWKSKNIRTIKITKVKRKKLKLNVKSLKIEIESMNVKEYIKQTKPKKRYIQI